MVYHRPSEEDTYLADSGHAQCCNRETAELPMRMTSREFDGLLAAAVRCSHGSAGCEIGEAGAISFADFGLDGAPGFLAGIYFSSVKPLS